MGKFSFQLNQSIMRYVAAALLAGLGGKSIDANNIKSILGSVGIEAESEKNRFGSQGTCWQGSRRTYCRRPNQISFNASRRRCGAAPAAGGAAAPAADAGAKEEKKEEP